MKKKITFEQYLKKDNLAENSIGSCLWTVNYFTANYEQVSSESLLAYKGFLMIIHFKSRTANLRIQAMNKYLDYLGKPQLRLKVAKIQQKLLENVISNTDCRFLKQQFKKDGVKELCR